MEGKHLARAADRLPGSPDVVVWANQKGGAGKSTLALSHAAQAARAGNQALGVDTDPQATMTYLHKATGYTAGFVLEQNRNPATLASLRRIQGLYDLIVVDTPGNLEDEVLAAALQSADLVVIPCIPEPAFVPATLATARFAASQGADYVILINQDDPVRGSGPAAAIRKGLDAAGQPVLRTGVRRYAAWPQSQLDGVLIPDYRGRGRPRSAQWARDDLAAVYMELTALLLRKARA
jgi:chromosome partitioning protein